MKTWACDKCGLEILSFEKPSLKHWGAGTSPVAFECNGRWKLIGDQNDNVHSEDIHCPFCLEADFDLVGLKRHLLNGWCVAFNATDNGGNANGPMPEV